MQARRIALDWLLCVTSGGIEGRCRLPSPISTPARPQIYESRKSGTLVWQMMAVEGSCGQILALAVVLHAKHSCAVRRCPPVTDCVSWRALTPIRQVLGKHCRPRPYGEVSEGGEVGGKVRIVVAGWSFLSRRAMRASRPFPLCPLCVFLVSYLRALAPSLLLCTFHLTSVYGLTSFFLGLFRYQARQGPAHAFLVLFSSWTFLGLCLFSLGEQNKHKANLWRGRGDRLLIAMCPGGR